MRTTSGVGRAGALLVAAGAVAIGLTGCSSAAKTSAENAAAGISTTTQTGTSSDTPSNEPTSTATSSTDATSSSTSPRTDATTAASTRPVPSTTTPSKTPAPSTPATSKPTPSPKPSSSNPASPTAGHGTGTWANVPLGSNTPGQLDPRCLTGRVMCVDMKTRTLVWVIDGVPQYGVDVRFGDENNPTRLGEFSIYLKMKDCISTIYHTPMPDAMFFSGGEAVHFSIDFKTYGYAHHSHGCVNVRDRATLDKLFNEAKVGDKVVVYAG